MGTNEIKNMFNNNNYRTFVGLAVTIMIAATVWFSEVSSAQKWRYKEDLPMAPTAAAITGRVFQDFNGNGTFDGSPSDVGINGVTITAYDAAGAPRGSATTVQCSGLNIPVTGCLSASDAGWYSLSATGTGPYRIEFTNTPSYLNPGARSTDSVNGGSTANSGSTVQFVPDGNTINTNLALVDPNKFSSDPNPNTVTTVQNLFQRTGAFSAKTSLVRLPYNSTGHHFSGTTPTASYLGFQMAQHVETGGTYGIAWQGTRNRIYVGSHHKRYVGFGPNGPDAIYVFDNAGNTVGTIDLDTLTGTTNVAGNDVHDFTPSGGVIYDIGTSNTSFDGVGKRSFGDLDISGDQNTLFVVNLFNRRIYAINVSSGVPGSASLIKSWAAPDPTTAGRHRPFALAWHKGKLWIGSVDQNGSNAYVHSMTPNLATTSEIEPFSLEFTLPLNYPRQAFITTANSAGQLSNWKTWVSNPVTMTYLTGGTDAPEEIAYPQAILSDIDFDETGSMILGFRDRFGDQSGPATRFRTADASDTWGTSAGDIIRVCWTGASFVAEAGGGCSTSGGLVSSGPGGAISPEHYNWDTWDYIGDWDTTVNNGAYHWETTQGGLLQLAGKSTILSTAMDPINDYGGGYLRFENSTGRREGLVLDGPVTPATATATGGYSIYEDGDYGTTPPNDTTGNFQKGNGLGDIEALTAPAPLEIGNRVWRDANANGVQDPGELPIAGITVRLYQGSTLVGTAVTDANGEYYFVFSSVVDPTPGDNIGQVNGGILYNTAYEVRFDNPANYASGGPLNNLLLTRLNETSQNGDDDSSDSDASTIGNPPGSPAGNFPVISLTTGGPGANNHTFDVGFASQPTAAGVSVEGRVKLSAGNGVRNAMVILTEADGTQHTALTSTFGYYRFDDIEVGQTVVVSVRSKRFVFNPPSRIVSLTDGIANLDFIAKY